MNARIRPGRFKVAWCIAGIAVLPLSAILATGVVLLLDPYLGRFDNSLAPDYWAPVLAIYWLINGCCIGFLQKAIVKRCLRVDLGRWTMYSALGALLAGALAYPCLEGACLLPQFYQYRFGHDLTVTVELSLVALAYLTVLSAAQSLSLNRLVSASWRWIAAHAGPLILVALISVSDQMSPGSSVFDSGLTFALYVLVVTATTCLFMERLVIANRRASKAPTDDWAFQPVPIESESAEGRSVWDDAI